MTDKEQMELDGILETLYNIGRHKEAGGLTDKPLAMSEARQALLDWRDKAIENARANDPLKCEYGHTVYAHKTADGWCCACEADIAFMEQRISQRPAEKGEG